MKTLKKLVFVVFSLLLCMVMVGARANASTETVLRVEPKKSVVDVGSSFEVDVAVSDVFNLYGYEFQLHYDTSMLTITDMRPHTETTNEPSFVFAEYKVWKYEMNQEEGYAWLAVTLPYGTKEGYEGSGILATVRFTATAAGTATFTFPLHLLGDPQSTPIDHDVVQGKVTVGASSETNPSPEVDETPPSGSIKISEGAPYTNRASVKLTLSAYDEESGIDQMRLSNDATAWTEWETFATSKDWTLTWDDGTKTVYVQYKDKAGLESLIYHDTIVLDTTPPTMTIDWPSQGSEIKSSITQVQWTGTDTGSGIDYCEVRVDGGSWINVGNNVAYVLSTLADGSHSVEVKIVDKAGNSMTTSVDFTVRAIVTRGPVYSDAIVGATVIAPIVGVAVYFLKFRKRT